MVLVDDASTDGTGAIARALARARGRLTVLDGTPRPPGWAGKLWAVQQGVAATDAEFLLLTDADIVHDPAHVAALVAQAERAGADMVSEMVALNCESLAERALVPAFVYFFAMLYPFAWVNDPRRPPPPPPPAAPCWSAAARSSASAASPPIRGALIDDVALAAGGEAGRAGSGSATRSWRARSGRYPGFADIWRMVARSAYVQLRYSPLLLAATTLGHGADLRSCRRWPRCSARAGAPVLGLRRLGGDGGDVRAHAGALRAAAAVGALACRSSPCSTSRPRSARRFDHHRGRGVVWKRRAYPGRRAMSDVANVETWSGKDRGDENFPVGSR